MLAIAEKQDIAQELKSLATILISEQIVIDAKPVLDAESDVLVRSRPGRWFYQLNSLIIEVGGKGVRYTPSHAANGKTSCRLDIKIQGKSSISDQWEDPLVDNQVQIVLASKVGLNTYQLAWHLDSQSNRGTPLCVHPRYHITFGGRELYPHLAVAAVNQYSNLLLLDTPRLVHPPMDATLAIDFVLSHFAPDKWRRLRSSSQFVQLLKSSQTRLWHSFFTAGSNHCSGTKTAYSSSTWPQLA